MFRKTIILSLSIPLALLAGCEPASTSASDTTATTDAVESCFSTADGSTKCAVQPAGSGFKRDDQDVDGDGHADRFVCAHIVHCSGGRPDGAGGAAGPEGGPPAVTPTGSGPSRGGGTDAGKGGGQDAAGGAGRPHDGGGTGGAVGGPGAAGGARPPAAGGASSGQHGPGLDVPADADCEKLGCVDMRGDGSHGGGGASGQAARADSSGAPAGHADDMHCPAGGAAGGASGN